MRTAFRLCAFILMLLNASTLADSLRAADPIGGTLEDRLLIKETVKQFVLAWNQDDATQLSRLFTPNGTLISPSGATAQTRSGIKELLINEHREILIGTALRKTIQTISFKNSAAALVKGQYELGGIETFLGFVRQSMEPLASIWRNKMLDGSSIGPTFGEISNRWRPTAVLRS